MIDYTIDTRHVEHTLLFSFEYKRVCAAMIVVADGDGAVGQQHGDGEQGPS